MDLQMQGIKLHEARERIITKKSGQTISSWMGLDGVYVPTSQSEQTI